MKLVVYQGNKEGNKPFCKSDFTLKWSALSLLFAGKTENHAEDTTTEDTRDASKFGKLIIRKQKCIWMALPLLSKQPQTMPEFQIQSGDGKVNFFP